MFESEHKNNLEFVGTEVDLLEVLELMGRSKMVLNNLPLYQNGTHERIFSSMLSGAVCITNDFPAISEEFVDGENIVLYSGKDLDTLTDRIKELLKEPKEAKEIARKGQLIASQSHTWEKNAERILEVVGLKY